MAWRRVKKMTGWGSMILSPGCRTQRQQEVLMSRLCSSAHVRRTKPASTLHRKGELT